LVLTSEHVYLYDGKVVPGVTTILSRTGLADFSYIPESLRDYALERGSLVHEAAHYLLEDDLDLASVDPAIAGYLQALDKFIHHSDFTPELLEHKVFDPISWYAGTLDSVGNFPTLGRTIVDWKTGGMDAVRWQLAAYGRLVAPPVYNRVAVKLNKDGTYKLKHFPASTFKKDEADFLAARRVFGLLEQGA